MGTSLNHDIFWISPVAILCEDWSGVWQVVKERLAASNGDLDELLRTHPELMFEARRRHAIVDANPAALELLRVPDLESLVARMGELLPADPTSNGKVLRAMARGAASCSGERRLRHADGQVVPLMWRATLPASEAGMRRIYFFAIDVTEEKRAEEALLTARTTLGHAARLSLVGELTASVAHEMAQPIGAIASYAGAARRWLSAAPPNVTEALASVVRIGNSACHAAQVLKRVKDFSRRGQGGCVRLAPLEAVRQAIALVEHEARRNDTRLVVDMPDAVPEVLVDPTQLQQVLVNIVVNAIQAMAGAGSRLRCVTVSVRLCSADELTFLIRDTGPGISRDAAGQLFEPFYTSKTEGVGLGLSICKRIVEDHGGRLWAGTVDSGAEFGFSIPLAVAAQVDTAQVRGTLLRGDGPEPSADARGSLRKPVRRHRAAGLAASSLPRRD